MVQSHPDAPEIHGGSKCFPHGFPEDGPLVHVRVKVLLCPVQGHELLVILKLTRSPEVSQLVDDCPVVLDELHDVARLEVAVNQIVVSQMIHPGRQMRENEHELVLIETVTVLWVIKKVKNITNR